MTDDNTPHIGETCKQCDQPIVRERTAVQIRKAGFEPSWCCGWDCVVKLAVSEGGKT